MKIIHVNKFFGFGSGVETYMHDLIRYQRAAGHEVHVFATRSSMNVQTEDAKYFVERMDLRSNSQALHKAINFIWNTQAERAFARMIHDIEPDIINLHNIYHHLSTSILRPIRRAQIPCVQMLHDYKLVCPSHSMFTENSVCERCKQGNYLNAIKHHCFTESFIGNALGAFEMGMTKLAQSYERTVQRFLCPSQFIRDKMVEWGESASKFDVILNAVDLAPELAPADGGYACYIGRLSEEKGIDILVRAVARIPELPLKIVGTGRDEGRLKKLVEELRATNIEFLGFKHAESLTDIRRHAMFVAVPSIWYENAPSSILEPQADGVPVIGSRIGGIPEMITHGKTGWLANAQDVDDWTTSIRSILSSSVEQRRQMVARAYAVVAETRTWPKHVADVEQSYTRAAEGLTRAFSNR